MEPYIPLAIVASVVVLGIVATVGLLVFFAGHNRNSQTAPAPAPAQPPIINVFADVTAYTAYDVLVVDGDPCDHTACAQNEDIARLQDQIDDLRGRHERLARRFGRLAANVSLLARQIGDLFRYGLPDHAHGQYAFTSEVNELRTEVARLRNPQRWTPSLLAAIIGAIVGALIGWGTLFLITAHPFTFAQHGSQMHFDLNVSHIVFQLVWIALFAIVGAGVAVFGHGLLSRNQEV